MNPPHTRELWLRPAVCSQQTHWQMVSSRFVVNVFREPGIRSWEVVLEVESLGRLRDWLDGPLAVRIFDQGGRCHVGGALPFDVTLLSPHGGYKVTLKGQGPLVLRFRKLRPGPGRRKRG